MIVALAAVIMQAILIAALILARKSLGSHTEALRELTHVLHAVHKSNMLVAGQNERMEDRFKRLAEVAAEKPELAAAYAAVFVAREPDERAS